MAGQTMPRVALVTGVGRREGIGAAIGRGLAKAGMTLCLTWWDEANSAGGGGEPFGEALAHELVAEGHRVFARPADLGAVSEPARLIAEFNDLAGEISVVVNNATVSEPAGIDDMTVESLDRHLAVNVRGMALLTQAYVRQFRSGEGGRIVNLTSGQSLGPMPDELAYAASKGAVEAFTTSLSPALMARGITINAVNPGPTDNGWMSEEVRRLLLSRAPSGRLSVPEDAARLVAFLASPEAGWITGQIIHSEGGFLR
ncbi:MAG: SDR family oxidoreductase [Thermomicrobiales bacterium]